MLAPIRLPMNCFSLCYRAMAARKITQIRLTYNLCKPVAARDMDLVITIILRRIINVEAWHDYLPI